MWKILRIFYGFLLEKKAIFALSLVITVVAGIINSLVPFFMRSFVETLQQGNTDQLYTLIPQYIALLFGGLLVSIISWHIGDHVLIDAARNARTRVFAYIQDLDFAFHVSKSTGSLISAIKRGDGAFFTLYFAIHQRIFEVLIGFTVMFITFTHLHPIIGVTVAVSFLVTILVSYFLIKINIYHRNKLNDAEDDVSAVIVDNLIGFETVKLFAKEKNERKRLAEAYKTWTKGMWGYQNSFRYYDLGIGTTLNLSVTALLYLTAIRLSNGSFSLGDFILVITFVNAFFPRVWELIWAIRDIAKSYSDIQKYFEILFNVIQVKDPEVVIPLPNIAGKVDFEDVNFTYNKTKKKSIQNFNLNVKPGESVALVGRSGAGKTTIVKLLMRFYDVDAGSIKVDDLNIKNLTKEQLRSFIGVVPQEPVLFNNTIAYNIAYGADKATEAEIKAAAKLANIDSFIESLADGYETNVGERGIKLSGGQKQRLAIARMILSNPKIVIFDEATSHLDSESEKLIQDAFWRASKNKTTFIIAHRLSTVMRADKIVVIERGKIAEIGTHKELLSQNNSVYKYLWDLQVNVS